MLQQHEKKAVSAIKYFDTKKNLLIRSFNVPINVNPVGGGGGNAGKGWGFDKL